MSGSGDAPPDAFRPPATPLVVCDPYFSVWSTGDTLTDGWSRHWTGALHPLCGLARIDGERWRFLGGEPRRRRTSVPAMAQTSLRVHPTRTVAVFEAAGVELTLTFTTPALPDDLDLLSRPVTYLDLAVRALDGREHDVALYLDVGARLAVNTPDQPVVWGRHRLGAFEALFVGAEDQRPLSRSGDDLRIDWGWLYLVAPPGGGEPASTSAASDLAARGAFLDPERFERLPDDDPEMPRAPDERPPTPVLACAWRLGAVGEGGAERTALLAYDDRVSVEWMQRRLRPWWRRDGAGVAALLRASVDEHAALVARCRAFDEDLEAELRAAGGEGYATLASLAFRQCLAAHKLVADLDGTPLYFSKENFSNGCMGTVDVTYPSSPFFLRFNPALLRAQLEPVLAYAASPRWPFPFAPHDVGRYPLANGQVYGGGETSEVDQMPVEECGNMLILLAALARAEGDASLAEAYWPQASAWATYLAEKGLDPENQLCTDDFAGHLAHNVNLSLKAVVALGAYAGLAEATGRAEEAARTRALATDMAARWRAMADDGEHTRLTFDRPGSWSQKYNLVWDDLLELDLFAPEVAAREVASYLGRQERYGLPLDGRERYTKLDWIVWSATLAERREDFEALVAPLVRWAHETPARVPLCDWYWTHDGAQAGFQARSVVGGVFIALLADGAWGAG